MQRRVLSSRIQADLLQDFCEALLSIHTTQEAAQFLGDLLTKRELAILAKRIQIAKLLLKGAGYRAIEESLGVSHSTIAKVAAWLEESGEGFRLVAERTKGVREKTMPSRDLSEWSKLKRRYPIAFWPQLLLEEVIRAAKKSDRERIQKAVEKLDHKSKLYKQLRHIGKT